MPKGNFTKNGGWSTKWTNEELIILRDNYPVGGAVIYKILPPILVII